MNHNLRDNSVLYYTFNPIGREINECHVYEYDL